MGSRAENRAVLWVRWLWTSGNKGSGYLALIPNEKGSITASCSLSSQWWFPEPGASLALLCFLWPLKPESGHKQVTSSCFWENTWLGRWAPVWKVIYGDRRFLILCCNLFSWTVCPLPLICCDWAISAVTDSINQRAAGIHPSVGSVPQTLT